MYLHKMGNSPYIKKEINSEGMQNLNMNKVIYELVFLELNQNGVYNRPARITPRIVLISLLLGLV